MKIKIYYLILFLSSISYSQSFIVENTFELEVKNVKQRSRLFQVHFKSYYIRVPNDSKKIQFRIKTKSLSHKKESFDPNKLYIVLNDKKLRLRAFDGDFARLVDVNAVDLEEYYGYSYKPEIIDTFKEYQLEGFTDMETCIDFGTKKKPHVKPIYFNHINIKSGVFNIYFSMPKDQKKYELYYGTVKLMEGEIN